MNIILACDELRGVVNLIWSLFYARFFFFFQTLNLYCIYVLVYHYALLFLYGFSVTAVTGVLLLFD